MRLENACHLRINRLKNNRVFLYLKSSIISTYDFLRLYTAWSDDSSYRNKIKFCYTILNDKQTSDNGFPLILCNGMIIVSRILINILNLIVFQFVVYTQETHLQRYINHWLFPRDTWRYISWKQNSQYYFLLRHELKIQ